MAGKWMQALRERMASRGTKGSLREAAGKSGKSEKLSPEDLARMERKARSMKDASGKLTKAGLALLRKVVAARNMMKSRK